MNITYRGLEGLGLLTEARFDGMADCWSIRNVDMGTGKDHTDTDEKINEELLGG